MELFNLTPFVAERMIVSSRSGRDTLMLVVKATFSLKDIVKGIPIRADVQGPVSWVDEYMGQVGQSSLTFASDLAFEKPGAEIIVVGHATPRRASGSELRLRMGSIDKRVQVHGERVWVKGSKGYRPSAPVPLDRVPLVWERAFGGVDETTKERFGANPIGCGFRGQKSQADLSEKRVPNFCYPDAPIEEPSHVGRPAGFGFIAAAWEERRRHAGTFDDQWLKERCPFLPEDFDSRFFLCAPRDQRLERPLDGGEPVHLMGFSAAGSLEFLIPRVSLDLSVMMGAELTVMPAVCDTAIIDIDASLLMLVWRARHDVHDRLEEIHWIRAALAEAPRS